MRFEIQRLRRQRLPISGHGKVRIAQLSASPLFDGAELFLPERWSQLQGYAPNVFVGSSFDLLRLVERVDLKTLEIDSLDHSIHVLTQMGDKPVTDVLRVVLWQRFGVPVFEVYTDGAGNLLAYECEAHDGWHIESTARFAIYDSELVLQKSAETAVRTGLIRHLESQPCVCGRSGVRIMGSPDRFATVDESLLAAIA